MAAAVDVVVDEASSGEDDLLANSDCVTLLGKDHSGRKVLRLTGRSVPPLYRVTTAGMTR